MKEELKRGLIHNLDPFIQRKDFYYRVGRTWTRIYLLCGPLGMGKTCLVAAMAKSTLTSMSTTYSFQLRDVKGYLNHESIGEFSFKSVLSGVMNNSILLVEDIDEVNEGSTVLALSDLLRSLVLGTPWGEARIVIFTTNDKGLLDPTLLSRMSVEIYMGHCCFEGFKVLASNYMGLSHDNDEPYRLYPDIKRLIDGQVITPAQVTEELMKSQNIDVVLEGLVKTLESLTLDKIDEDGEKTFGMY